MRTLDHPEREDIDLDAVLAALADPIRRRIACELAEGHTDMACIAFELPVSKSTSTHHFRVLREAGVIRQRYQGTAILNSLRADDLQARFPGLLGAVIGAHRGADAGGPAEASSAHG
ncbi:ArsR/SmtB family transcription factor [Nocardiopsis baichengensis]|uniref:ArsR/SmtB family transcription factor n=1 Tax=Nocardiopsis baichengensis TaxID=280240 RepID=UPI000346A4B9|nr:metalloregulator ArsR/SmtB family transcription factor [Nocardiopsis baichengensis]